MGPQTYTPWETARPAFSTSTHASFYVSSTPGTRSVEPVSPKSMVGLVVALLAAVRLGVIG